MIWGGFTAFDLLRVQVIIEQYLRILKYDIKQN